MPKSNHKYTVIREYESLYNMEGLVRRIIRTHIEMIQEGKEVSECAEGGE